MSHNVWWGDFTFEHQEQKCWIIGDRAIVIKRNDNEWNSWNVETPEEVNDDILVSGCANLPISEEIIKGRFLERNTSNTIKVMPKLADKSVVARPASPLTILAGETVQLFISTPIWFYAQTSPGNKSLLDLPFWRPSDSWFGASTIDGEICYAKYTSAKTRIEDLEMRAHRAITPITVTNSYHEAFTINRINVPVNYLHLYSNDENQLWTYGVEIERKNKSDNVELIFSDHLLHKINSYELVSEPRLTSDHGKLTRSISNLFG